MVVCSTHRFEKISITSKQLVAIATQIFGLFDRRLRFSLEFKGVAIACNESMLIEVNHQQLSFSFPEL